MVRRGLLAFRLNLYLLEEEALFVLRAFEEMKASALFFLRPAKKGSWVWKVEEKTVSGNVRRALERNISSGLLWLKAKAIWHS